MALLNIHLLSSLLLSANWVNPSWVALGESRGHESPSHKLFMRNSGEPPSLHHVPCLNLCSCSSQDPSYSILLSIFLYLVLHLLPTVLIIDALLYIPAVFLFSKAFLRQLSPTKQVCVRACVCVCTYAVGHIICLVSSPRSFPVPPPGCSGGPHATPAFHNAH